MRTNRSAIAWLGFGALLAACSGDPGGIDDEDGAGGADDGPATTASASGGNGEGAGTGEGGSVPPVEDPFDPPPAPTPFTDAELDSLRGDIDDALATASGSYSVVIVGLDSGQLIYEKNPDTGRKPASNTKLFTTAATLLMKGEAGRPKVGVYASGVNGGPVQGDIVLVAEHDPSATPWFGDGSRQSFDAIADALATSGISAVSGGVIAKGEYLYEGNSLGTIDFPSERAQAASAFRAALVAAGVDVAGGASGATGFDPPANAQLLVAGPSASSDASAHAINVPSHNEMADLAMHHLGFLDSGTSTYAAGFGAIEAALDGIGVAHGGLDLNDGSGLSHDNRATPRHIADLFVALAERREWSAYVGSMAVSGLRGTIASRMTGANTSGRFWGKTGTLTGVVALSGVLFHRHDGQRYVASFLVNDVGSSTAARAAMDAAVGELAADRKEMSGVPDAPVLKRVIDDRNGATATVELGEVDGATGYLVWRSPDGRSWRREDARLIQGTTHRTMVMDDALFVRVTAVGAAGESAPSNMLATRVATSGARALFVDGNDRYAAGPVPENPLGWGHDAVVAHAAAIAGPFESASHLVVEDGSVDLAVFERVVWALGRESTDDLTFSTTEQGALAVFVEGGGRLFVSGAEVGYDLIDQGAAADAAFAADVLGIDYVSDDAGTTFVGAGDVDWGHGLARFSKLGRHEVAFPDVLAPAAGGAACLTYLAGANGAACVATDTPAGGRVIVVGFPLESLDDPAAGAALVALLGP